MDSILNLANQIRNMKPPIGNCLMEMFISICCKNILLSLQELDKNKIIHNQIQGSNIIYTKDGNVKLDLSILYNLNGNTCYLTIPRACFFEFVYWAAPV